MSKVKSKNTKEQKHSPLEITGMSEDEIREVQEKLSNCNMPKVCNNKWNTEKQTDLNRYFSEL